MQDRYLSYKNRYFHLLKYAKTEDVLYIAGVETCGFFIKAVQSAETANIKWKPIKYKTMDSFKKTFIAKIQSMFKKQIDHSTSPFVWRGAKNKIREFIGGCTEFMQWLEENE